jgi:fatty acid-binding protein DegV
MSTPPVIGIVIESSAELPMTVARRFGIEVVPVTVTVDGVDHLDGVDLDRDDFAMSISTSPDERPAVGTSEPSSGQFALAYDALVGRGCTAILSVHASAATSGSLNAARLAARTVEVPVRLVDSGTVGAGVALAAWAAAEAVEAGADLDAAAAVAEVTGPQVSTVFVVQTLAHPVDGLPVLTVTDGQVQLVDRVPSMVDAVAVMAGFVIERGPSARAVIGVAHPAADPVGEALEAACGESAAIAEVVRHRAGPSVIAQTGPGTLGVVVAPAFRSPAALEPSTPTAS